MRARSLRGALALLGLLAVPLDAAAHAVAALSRFCSAHWDRVAVAEINPLIAVLGNGAVAVDGLIEMR